MGRTLWNWNAGAIDQQLGMKCLKWRGVQGQLNLWKLLRHPQQGESSSSIRIAAI